VHTYNWGTQAKPGGAPKQAVEAIPISQGGDARAADRPGAHPGGGGGTPWAFASCVGNLGITSFSKIGSEPIATPRYSALARPP
jgi:hypothetical protein